MIAFPLLQRGLRPEHVGLFAVRLTIWVVPGSSRTVVGGSRNGALVVRVRERPERGRATEAAITALAKTLAVERRAVSLVSGTKSRTKLVDIVGDDARLEAEVANLASSQ